MKTSPWLRLNRGVRRTVAVARKEVAHISRDPSTLYLALGLPVVLLVIFGYGISFDLDNAPIAVVDQDRTPATRSLVQSLGASGELHVVTLPASIDAVEPLFRRGSIRAAVVLPAGLGRMLARSEAAPVQILVDGSDGTTAGAVLGTATAILLSESRMIALAANPRAPSPPLETRIVSLYNPGLRSAVFFVPGLMVYILAIAGVLLTALTVSREWERGNMEQLFATPVGRLEILLGKLAPYLVIGMVQALLVLSVGMAVFDVPMVGSLPLLALGVLVFLTAALSQGLFISVVARNQQVATQAGALSSLLPALLLSGFLIPVESMPVFLQWLAAVFPARYFMDLIRGVMLKGSGLSIHWIDLAGMAAFTAVVLTLATLRFKRRVA